MSPYTIVSGDTLDAIANGHGIQLQDLLNANTYIDPNNLQLGQGINIPDGSGPVPRTGNGGGDSIPGYQGGSGGGGGYEQYSGPASSFPDRGSWASYDFLWQSNERLMKFHDSDEEIGFVRTAIMTVATEAGVDIRAILCIVVQESGGNVRITSTNNGINNPGLMQSHNGVSFDPNDPQGSILQMVRDGTTGTGSGDGLKQCIDKSGGSYYEAFRMYNSGSVNHDDMNDPVGATASYVRDAANRLMGHEWDGM